MNAILYILLGIASFLIGLILSYKEKHNWKHAVIAGFATAAFLILSVVLWL